MKKNLTYTLCLVWKADKGFVIWTLIRCLANGIFGTYLSIYMTKYILTCIEQRRPLSELIFYIAVICTGHIVVHIVSATHEYVMKRNTPAIYRNVFNKVIDKSSRMEYVRFEEPDFYDRFTRALDASVSQCLSITENFSWFLGDLIGMAIAVEFVARTDAFLLLFTVIPIIFNIFLGLKANKLYFDMDMETTRDNRVAGYAKRVFYEKKYAGEIRLYGIRNVLLNYHEKASENKYKTVKKYRKKIFLFEALTNTVFGLLCNIAPFVYIAFSIKNNPSMEVGAFIAAGIAAVGYIAGSMRWVVENAVSVSRDCRYIQNLRDFLEYEPCAKQGEAAIVPETLEGVEIKDLEFTYQGADKPTIKNLTLSVKRGEKIALVGHNGAGKTTLIKLIMGLYEPTGGEICVGGHNIHDYDPKEYRSHFGTVFQDLQVFALTVAENVLMRKPENQQDCDIVTDALEKAQFGGLPGGIDTVVSREYDENGLVLSGGQAQKIAIARVFAKNPDIVILDEPSSALDPIAEFNMYENMLRLSENKAVILISHRLSSARIADKIYMLENGSIIEQGTHDELMEQGGKYAHMFLLQAQNYQESLPEEMEEMLNAKKR